MHMKNILKFLFVSFVLLLLALGGYFAIGRFQGWGKRSVTYTQESAEFPVEKQQETKEELSQQAGIEKPTQEVGNEVEAANKNVPAEKQAGQDVKVVAEKNQTPNTLKPENDLVSFGFQKATDRKIKAVIIHTTYNALGGDPFDFQKVMQEWKDAGVAPHYAIDREGKIHQLVAEQNIAWHAGASKLPDGTTDVNGASIGIEVVNDKESKFSDAEYAALNQLLADLKKKYSIKFVLGHDEIAPGRKTDPWGIEWGKVSK
jgi:hypothetical protein